MPPLQCPRCGSPVDRSDRLFSHLGLVVLRCRACRMFAIEGDPTWVTRDKMTVHAIQVYNARQESEIARQIVESADDDPRWARMTS